MSRLCSKQSGYVDSIGNAVCTNAWVLETLTDLLDWALALSQLLLQITLQQQVPHSSESITLQHQPPNSSVNICYLGQTLSSFARLFSRFLVSYQPLISFWCSSIKYNSGLNYCFLTWVPIFVALDERVWPLIQTNHFLPELLLVNVLSQQQKAN